MIAALASPMLTTPWPIIKTHRENSDTFTLELEPPESNGPFAFKPGQFNMLYVFGVGEIPISISSDAGNPETILHTTRKVGTVTNALGELRTGDSIGIRGPFGTNWPVEEAVGKDVVIVAGGIGLAPLRPALLHLLEHRRQYKNVILLYGSRTPEEMLFRKDLEKWSSQLDIQVYVTVDRATRSWRGMVGVVTPLVHRAPFDRKNAVAMVCGPEIMMRYATEELQRRGVPDDMIYLSMERNMKCAIGMCGHCQYSSEFICKDGPVFSYDRIAHLMGKNEV